MPEIARGIIPAGKRLLPLIFLIGVGTPLAAKADNGIVDVRALPRLEGAVEDTSRTQSYSMSYGVPTVVAVTSAATKKLLAADGWVQFLRPLDEKSSLLTFKKAQQGLNVHFTQGLGRPDQSVVYYTADRITSNVPFPPDATDIVFDQHRPYLGCIAPARLRRDARFLPQGDGRDRLETALRRRCHGAVAQRGAWRDGPERRARLLHPRRRRGLLSAAPDHADAATPRRRQDRRGNPGRAVRAAANAGGRFRDGRPAATKTDQDREEYRRLRLCPPTDGGRRYRRASRNACLLSPRTRKPQLDRRDEGRGRHAG